MDIVHVERIMPGVMRISCLNLCTA